MRRTDIINALVAQGYKAEAKETIKNGVVFEGIMIKNDDTIAPVIYTEQLLRDAEEKGKGISEVVADIIRVYEESRYMEIPVDDLMDRDYFLNNVFIGLQKTSAEFLVKKFTEYDGIEAYLYIRRMKDAGGIYSVKVTPDYLGHTGVDVEEVWKSARKNTFAETELKSMASVIADMCGIPEEEVPEMDNSIYVVSNRCKMKGASAILNKDMLSGFAKQHGVSKLVVLPSSIHEMLVLPYDASIDMDMMSEMVREVNDTQVLPEERLTDQAYLINVK